MQIKNTRANLNGSKAVIDVLIRGIWNYNLEDELEKTRMVSGGARWRHMHGNGHGVRIVYSHELFGSQEHVDSKNTTSFSRNC